MKGNGRLTLVTTVLALGLVALLHSEAVSALVLARNIGSAQSKTTGTEPAGGVAAGFLLTACDAFTTPTAAMVNCNRPDSSPGETAAFNDRVDHSDGGAG